MQINAQILINLYRANGHALVVRLYENGWRADADMALKFHQTATGWRVIDEDGSIETYDLIGKLLSITDRKGIIIRLGYNTAG